MFCLDLYLLAALACRFVPQIAASYEGFLLLKRGRLFCEFGPRLSGCCYGCLLRVLSDVLKVQVAAAGSASLAMAGCVVGSD